MQAAARSSAGPLVHLPGGADLLLMDGLGAAVGRRQDRLEQRHEHHGHGHDDGEDGRPDRQSNQNVSGVDGGDGGGDHAPYDDTVTDGDPGAAAARPAPSDEPPAAIDVRADRVVFRARRPALLVVPFALATEVAGVFFIVNGAPIGWFVVAAPVAALLVTAVLFRPTLELTREGLLQRQYPFSSLTRWEVIDHVGVTRAGNRTILAYRLRPGCPPPRRQPAAGLLRAAGRPFDGGWFADSLAGRPDEILAVVDGYLADPQRRLELPPARR